MKRIKHNDLLPWFTMDHDQLPEAYLKSCRKFFKEISDKRQAASNKQLDMKEIIGYSLFISRLVVSG